MRAVRIAALGQGAAMPVESVGVPRVGKDGVLVAVHVAGINPVDTYIASGTYAVKPNVPYTPGKDGAGEVVAVGEDVRGIKEGDRVYIDGPSSGTLAEYCVVPASSAVVVPPSVSFETLACLGVPSSTAYRALFHRCAAKPGERVLVHGAAGAVGLCAVQLAKGHGCVVYGTASTEEGRKAALDAGCTAVGNHHEIASLLQNENAGYDVVIEMLANVSLAQTLPHLAPGARVGVVGNRGLADGVNFRDLMAKEACVLGVMLGRTTAEERARANAHVVAAIADGSLTCSWVPAHGAFDGLETAGNAFARVLEAGRCGRVVVRVR